VREEGGGGSVRERAKREGERERGRAWGEREGERRAAQVSFCDKFSGRTSVQLFHISRAVVTAVSVSSRKMSGPKNETLSPENSDLSL